MKITDLNATEIAAKIRSREISPVESIQESLERIEERNPRLNAFVHLCPERALDAARQQEKAILAGEDPGPLAGLALGVKDLEDVAGLPTTFGSVPFRDFVPRETSVHVERLCAAARSSGSVPWTNGRKRERKRCQTPSDGTSAETGRRYPARARTK